MPKPEASPAHPPPAQHSLALHMTLAGHEFRLQGVFALAEGMAAFDRWAEKLGGNDATAQAKINELVAKLKAANDQLAATVSSTPTPTP